MAAIPSMFVVNPQVDMRALAGAAVFFTGSLFGAHTNTGFGSQSTYGTHELAVKQGAQVSSVWGSQRGTAVARAKQPFIQSSPQLDLTPSQSIWRSVAQPAATRLFPFTVSAPQPDLTQTTQLWRSAAAAPAASAARLFPFTSSASQVDPTQLASQLWKSATAAPLTSAQRLLNFTVTAPQADPTQIQPNIWEPIPGLSTNSGQGASYTFGTHALAIAQSQNVSSVWPSAKTPPVIVANPVSAWFRTQPQIDHTPIQSQVWRSANNPGGWINLGVGAFPQDDPTLTQSQVFKSQPAASVATSAPRLLPFVQTASQFNPAQIQPQVTPSALTITYAVETWVSTAPQTDPTQIPSKVFASLIAPPQILGPTVTPFVLNGQPDLNLYTVAVWTPSTFSPSAPLVTPVDQPSGGWERHHHFYYDFDAHRQRRIDRDRDLERREREAEKLETVDREIARLLHEQEAKDAEKADLARLQALADQYAGTRQEIPRQIAATLLKAQEERSKNALEQLAREMERMLEEEEMALMVLLLSDD